MLITANIVLPTDVPYKVVQKMIYQGITDFLVEQQRDGFILRQRPTFGRRGPHPDDPYAEIWWVAADLARAPVKQTFEVDDAVARLLLKDPKWHVS